MLTQLHIQNFALIRKMTLEFSPKLNVLTGETGAGKSILIDAIRYVLGERTSPHTKTQGAEPTRVEALFEIQNTSLWKHEVLSPFTEEEESLIIRRETSSEGKSRAWVNNRGVNQSILKQIGILLLDIHGQYDHQRLLDASSHLDLVDSFAKNEALKEQYKPLYENFAELKQRQMKLKKLEEGRERELDLLKYQVEEIEAVHPEEDEEDELKREQARFANAEKLYESTARILKFLEGEERSVSDLLQQAYRDVNQLAKLDESVDKVKSDYESCQLNFEEISREIREYQENLSFEPERFQEIEKRLDQIDLLKRKYGGSVSKVLAFYEESKQKYDELFNKGLYEKETEAQLSKVEPKLRKIAEQITETRKKAISLLKRTIEKELKDLQIANARFEAPLEKSTVSNSGCDRLEFMMTLNAGQEVMPLRKIISGGEASRVMLAMKKALIKVDPVETLIFDEIDANIGGRLGEVTGKKLKEIAGQRQVLLITHLPQIASFADCHFKVTKNVQKGVTLTDYQMIEGEARVQELAQMMSGKKETDISKKHAKEMLGRVKP